MENERYIAKAFDQAVSTNLPADLDPQVKDLLRRWYFAGFGECVNMHIRMGDLQMPPLVVAGRMDALVEELQAFFVTDQQTNGD